MRTTESPIRYANAIGGPKLQSVKFRWTSTSTALLVGLLTLAAKCPQIHGDVITIVNAGFEANQLAADSFSGLPSHPGWTDAFANVGGVAHPPLGAGPALIHTIDSAPEGNQFGYARNGSGLIQTLTETFDPAFSYTLTLDAALSSLSSALILPGTDVGYRVQLGTQAGGVLAAAEFTESGGTLRNDTFQQVSVAWTPGDSFAPASVGESLQILLLTINNGTNGGAVIGAAFDDLRLDAFNTAAVPEPSTVGFLLTAMAMSAGLRRFKRRQK